MKNRCRDLNFYKSLFALSRDSYWTCRINELPLYSDKQTSCLSILLFSHRWKHRCVWYNLTCDNYKRSHQRVWCRWRTARLMSDERHNNWTRHFSQVYCIVMKFDLSEDKLCRITTDEVPAIIGKHEWFISYCLKSTLTRLKVFVPHKLHLY